MTYTIHGLKDSNSVEFISLFSNLSIYVACAICSWHTILCHTSHSRVFRQILQIMSFQSLILSVQSFFCRPCAFDPGILLINICDSNLFPFKICPKNLHLALPILYIGLNFLLIVFIIHTFNFFCFQLTFNILR